MNRLTPNQEEELFMAAMRVSNHATQAEVLAKVKFTDELDGSLSILCRLLARLEPLMKKP